jgi:FAD/FMN-containing dehydrogenase
MTLSNIIASELEQCVGPGVIVVPDPQNVVRHLRDYGVQGSAATKILALAYPRNTQDVSSILKYCNEHRIPVQPQGGMTGLAGGGVHDQGDRHGDGHHHG